MKFGNKHSFGFYPNISYEELMTNPILDIAARFWDDDRYAAFKILYQSFRIMDDLVDKQKIVSNEISKITKQRLINTLEDWVDSIQVTEPVDTYQRELVKNIVTYKIPLWPWQKFSESMSYELHNNGFKTFQIFLEYAEGAVIAPASIFVHLCGVKKHNGHYYGPTFDIRDVATSAALFAYIVHIIRDFQNDQNNNLNYFADDLIAKHGLDASMLRKISTGVHIPPSFRGLIKEYCDYAEYYRKKTRLTLNEIKRHLEPRYQLSLEIVYDLYLQIYERIDIQNGQFTTNELNPSPKEIKDRIDLVVTHFNPL